MDLNRLPPGASWGLVRKNRCQELLYVVSGTGEALDNGVRTPVSSGDLIVTNHKEVVALRNTGETDLVFLNLVIQQKVAFWKDLMVVR